MNDLIRPSDADPVVHTIVELVGYRAATALPCSGRDSDRQGLLLVGGGAAQPELVARNGGRTRPALRSAADLASPLSRGAALAALSPCAAQRRRPPDSAAGASEPTSTPSCLRRTVGLSPCPPKNGSRLTSARTAGCNTLQLHCRPFERHADELTSLTMSQRRP